MEDVGKATILRLLRIVAGKAPIPHGVEVLAQDVVIHMDGHTFSGINTWAAWITYLRTRNRVSDLDVVVDRLVGNADGTITAHGRWKARRQGKEVSSADLRVCYRVVEGVVVEIWTTRTNYSFPVGPFMDSSAGHLLIMAHVFFWAKNSGVPDLRVLPAAVSGSPPVLNTGEEAAGA
ncbi:MAG: hypothetical protein ACO1SX_24520 [Actinomycetota bacterium]